MEQMLGKIDAIRLIRHTFEGLLDIRVGLKDAKDIVDTYMMFKGYTLHQVIPRDDIPEFLRYAKMVVVGILKLKEIKA